MPESALAPPGPVLVTGGTGFIGSHLVARLAQTGAEVHAVSRQDVPHAAKMVRWWQADLAELAAVQGLVRAVRPAVIFHLASHVAGARDLALVIPTFASNLTSTVNLLTAAAEIGDARVVLAGSMEEPESGAEVPCSPYAAAKFAASGYARMFHALFGLPVVTLRLFMVYGPGQRDLNKLVPYVILSLLRGEPPRLMSGDRAVDWIFVADVVDALMAAARARGIDGARIDVGSGELVTVKEIVERLVAIINPGVEPRFGAVPDRVHERISVADVRRSQSLLGWQPSMLLDGGLRRTVDWYRATTSLE
jgi:UDP-glucose 4-epimerase